ncbi:MAG: flagellar motor switch protein FliG [Deltaproteobacteria bacterium]|nr:MAG: flagellar motor switch protein FliG [Deltaproteobacteria bacterium]
MAEEKDKKAGIPGAKKAAILMLTMGESYAADMFSRLSDREIKVVAAAMAQIEKVTPEERDEVMGDFIEKFEGDTSMMIQGQHFAKILIERTLDRDKARSIYKDIEDRNRAKPFIWSRDINVSAMAGYLESEHPQTIAMILAHLPGEVASEVMVMLPDEKKGDIASRIATLGQVPEDIVRDVDEALKAELSLAGTRGGKVGGLQVLVDILNGVDKATEDIIMEYVEADDSEMASDIRDMMFVFEDLSRVDDRAMREILKKVEGQQLTLALKTASEEMKQKILGNLSSRAAEMLMEDLEVMGPVKLSEVEEAHQEIVRAAKELEAEGAIVLGGKGKDDVLV